MLRADQLSVAGSGAPLSFEVAPGRCFGLLGRSADHTSRVLLAVAALMRPSAGAVTIGGLDTVRNTEAARRRVAMTRTPCLDARLRLREYLTTVAHARRLGGTASRGSVDLVMERLALDGALRLASPLARASAALAAALMPAVGLVVLDEPFRHVSADTRARAIEWIRSLSTGSVAVVIGGREEGDLRAVSHTVISLSSGDRR